MAAPPVRPDVPPPLPPAGGGKTIFQAEDGTVSLTLRGPTGLLTFAGTCSKAMREWLPKGLRDVKRPLAIKLRGLFAVDAPFLRELQTFVQDAARRKVPVTLLDVPARVVEILHQLPGGEQFPVLSCESALLEDGAIPDSLEQDRKALQDIASRCEINPLWRRVDQDGAWLCPLCGKLVEEAKIPAATRLAPAALRAIRRHHLDVCTAWRSGRTTPMPASMLDAYLQDINRKKATVVAERTRKLTQEVQGLQGRVEAMAHLEKNVMEAQRRQLHLIPIEPDPDAIADIAVVYRPLASVSGDFLDFYDLPGNRFGVAIGDVSGHGVEAAIIMGMAKMAFHIRVQGLGSPGELMGYANDDLFAELHRTAFVTGAFAVIDRATRKMTYVRAGHCPLLLRRGNDVKDLSIGGIPFGVAAGSPFLLSNKEGEADLKAGDIVLIYTDGVIEAGPPTAQFGMGRLRKALLAAPAGGTADAIMKSVVSALDAYLDQTPPGDDTTLVCLKIK
jgi:serine phosphatase RsbU (regulator of sigma subunit)